MNASSRPSSFLAYDVMLEAVRDMRAATATIEKHDRDLGNQLKRASASVVLNLAESNRLSAGNRRMRQQTALGSLYEVRAVFDFAIAAGYLDDEQSAPIAAKLRRVGGLIYGLLR